MLRVRSLAVQYTRDIVRSRTVGKGVRGATVRALTDITSDSTVAASVQLDGALDRDAAALEASGELELGQPNVSRRFTGAPKPCKKKQQWTPETELVSKLNRMRSNKGRGHAHLAMQMLEKARREGTVVLVAYNVVLRILGTEQWVLKDKTHAMEELVCQLQEDGLEPDVFTYNSIIYTYAQAADSAKAQRAFDEMLSKGIEPNALTLSNLIIAQSWRSHTAMYSTLAAMDAKGWVPTRSAHIRALSAMWQKKDTKGVLQIMRRMLEKDHRPNEASFAVSLMAAGQLGDADFAEDIFARRAAAGFGPKEEIYASMMLAHAKAGQHEEGLEYWRQLVCVDGIGDVKINLDTYHCALRSAVLASQWNEMEAILDVMKSHDIVPFDQTFKTAIAACRGIKGANGLNGPEYWERMERVVDAISRRGASPSNDVLLRMGMACVHAKEWEKAAALFENAMAQNCQMWPFAWECVIRTSAALGRYDVVKETWLANKAKDGVPTPRANELSMTAAQHLEDADLALEILATAKAKAKDSPTMHAIAIKMLAETGRLEEANDILQRQEGGELRLNHKKMNDLLTACEKYGDTETGLEFLKEMRAKKPPHRLQPPNMAFAIAALCKHGRASDALELYEEQLKAGYVPSSGCLVSVANAAFAASDRVNTIKYCEQARREGVSASQEAVAFAEGEGDDLDSADGRFPGPQGDEEKGRSSKLRPCDGKSRAKASDGATAGQ